MTVSEVGFAAEDAADDEAELVERARRSGIYSRREPDRLTSECRELLNRLYLPAWRTLKSKLRADGLAHKLRELELPAIRYSEDQWDLIHGSEDVRDDLALTMIDKAWLPFLRNVVERRKWEPRHDDGGSGLLTYFVNACVFTYPGRGGVFPVWAAQRRVLETAVDQEWSNQLNSDPAAAVASWDGLHRMVSKAPRSTRPVLIMLAFGYTQTEIAEHLGITHRSVVNRTWRYRCMFVRREIERGQLTPPPERNVLQPKGTPR